MSASLKTPEVMAMLAGRHTSQEWAFFEQVPNATGGQSSRTADALAMNLWPSRGLEVHGFEVKVSRGDWLRELKAPGKADEIFAYCDRWWLVVGEAEIVRPGELPPTWGLMIPRGDALVVKVQAPSLAPTPLDRPFIAAIIRRAAAGQVPLSTVEAAAAGRAKQAVDAAMHRAERAEDSLTTLRGVVEDFHKTSGVRIDNWRGPEQIGKAVRLVLDGGAADAIERLEGVRAHAARVLEEMDEEIRQARLVVPAEQRESA